MIHAKNVRLTRTVTRTMYPSSALWGFMAPKRSLATSRSSDGKYIVTSAFSPVVHPEGLALIGIQVKAFKRFFLCDLLLLDPHLIHLVYAIACRLVILVLIAYEVKVLARICHSKRIYFIPPPFFAINFFSPNAISQSSGMTACAFQEAQS